MNVLTKIGAALGAFAFVTVAGAAWHQKSEVDYLNAHQPPTLEQTLKSVVEVKTTEGGICSGWFLKGTNKVVTAAHCFEFQLGAVGNATVLVTYSDGTSAPFKITKLNGDATDDMHDWAVLEPIQASARVPEGLPVCSYHPQYGDALAVIGAPFGVYPSMNFGYVQNPSYTGPMSNQEGAPKLRGGLIIDGKVLPGNSGGPVVDTSSGCVVGTAEEIFVARDGLPPVSIAAPTYGNNFLDWLANG